MNGADKHKEYVKAGDGLLSQIDKVHEYPTEPLTEKKLCELHGVDSTEEDFKKELDLMRLYNRVLITFGIENQTFMLVEECAELLNAVAKLKRGRASKEDIITELSDVSIMVEQLAFFYGWDEFKEERELKLTRLKDRINHHIEKGGEK